MAEDNEPRVRLHTTLGEIILALEPRRAPVTVQNFLDYVSDGFYDGTLFHRVIPGFMIQAGGLTTDLRTKPTREPIKNEADNGLRNERGMVAMARTPDPDSATSQFFINLRDNPFLDHSAPTAHGWGYCVFGLVESGLDVVDTIAQVATTQRSGHANLPVEDVVIEKAEIL
mgnify:CR=1 FL=1